MLRAKKEHLWLIGFLLLWFGVNLLFLVRYPLVHSDEAWLSGLTRNMMTQGSLRVTEPFFDLKPRYPHAVKMVFHILQMPFIAAFGYGVFSIRLLSLLFGTLALWMTYRGLRTLLPFSLSLALTAAISVNGQLILASHTARQEIILLFLLLWCAVVVLQNKDHITQSVAVRLALLTGASIGLHPNSVLLAAGCGLALLFCMLINRQLAWKPLLFYVGITGTIAMGYVGLSLWFDNQFIPHWLQYGDTEFALLAPVSDKLGEGAAYLGRLWNGVSGTYALPELKPQLVLCTLLLILGIVQAVRRKSAAAAAILGLVCGAAAATAFIGRYNQLSAILWMFPCLLLLGAVLPGQPGVQKAAAALVAIVFAAAAAGPIYNAYEVDYAVYAKQISDYVSPDTKTLANLNAGFLFDNGKLLDVRNLSYLQKNEMTFGEYAQSRDIEVILWSDEMNYIYDNRPYFNVLYGNPRYVPEVEAFFEERCTLVQSFENAGYGMRIQQLIGEPCRIRIYRINP